MYSTAEFRKGLRIEIDGKLWVIVEFQHVKPGKGGAFVRTKLKNLETGEVVFTGPVRFDGRRLKVQAL